MHVLSTPPAFILSQDQTLKKMCLFQVQHKLTSLHIPFYCFKGSFDRSLNVPVSPGCLVQRIFEDCICVSLFSYQGSHLFTVLRQLVYYITSFYWCQLLFFIFLNKKQENGEGGIWTLAPLLTTYSLSRGAPSATWVLLHMPDSFRDDIFKSGEGGIRTHASFRTNGFQDRLVMTASIPLRASLTETIGIISAVSSPVNHYFHLFLTFFVRFFLLSFTGFLSILSIRITQNLCQ